MQVSLRQPVSPELSETPLHGVPGPPTPHCSRGLVARCRTRAASALAGPAGRGHMLTVPSRTCLPSPSWSPAGVLPVLACLLPILRLIDFGKTNCKLFPFESPKFIAGHSLSKRSVNPKITPWPWRWDGWGSFMPCKPLTKRVSTRGAPGRDGASVPARVWAPYGFFRSLPGSSLQLVGGRRPH